MGGKRREEERERERERERESGGGGGGGAVVITYNITFEDFNLECCEYYSLECYS